MASLALLDLPFGVNLDSIISQRWAGNVTAQAF
jgi:hypothetical protein